MYNNFKKQQQQKPTSIHLYGMSDKCMLLLNVSDLRRYNEYTYKRVRGMITTAKAEKVTVPNNNRNSVFVSSLKVTFQSHTFLLWLQTLLSEL